MFQSTRIGSGTISLLYLNLIVIVLVSLRGGFVASGAMTLIAVLCLNLFILPVVPALRAKNPLDIVATVAFLITAWVITGIVARLRERNALLDGLFDQSPQPVVLLDKGLHVVRINREFTRVLGYTPLEVSGRRLRDLIVPGDIVPGDLRDENQRYEEMVSRGQRVRGLSFDLRAADLDQFGLLPALLALFERYTTQTGVLVNFKHQGVNRRFSARVETGASRVVQEALTNACVGWPGYIEPSDRDRGHGFDPDAVLKAPASGGLIGMERIMLLGSRMSIESSPGSGTTITAELPLDKMTTWSPVSNSPEIREWNLR
jgi:PAS domain S-box-containing protein